MDCLIHPCYFPNIAHFVAMTNAEITYLEVCDHYQKQTYRNRTEIYGANGKLNLTVPVTHSQNDRKAYKEVMIFNNENWQQQHLKSLHTAYNASPFFEFYIDDLWPIFNRPYKYIIDLNLRCLEILQDALQLEIRSMVTETYKASYETLEDYRYLVNAKQNTLELLPYNQMFSGKHGFLSNLSILDLLFNEGPSSEQYLKNQNLKSC